MLLIPVQHLRILFFSSLFMFVSPFSNSEEPSSNYFNIFSHLLYQMAHFFGIITLLTTWADFYIYHPVPPPLPPFLGS